MIFISSFRWAKQTNRTHINSTPYFNLSMSRLSHLNKHPLSFSPRPHAYNKGTLLELLNLLELRMINLPYHK